MLAVIVQTNDWSEGHYSIGSDNLTTDARALIHGLLNRRSSYLLTRLDFQVL